MAKTKVALFGASWWPYAPFDELCIVTLLSLWVRNASFFQKTSKANSLTINSFLCGMMVIASVIRSTMHPANMSRYRFRAVYTHDL